MNMHLGTQRGMALLVVLMILAIMVIMASTMTTRYRLMWQRSSNQQISQQQRWYLLGSESLMGRILNQDISDSPDKTTRAQYWATEGKVFPIEDSTLTGEIVDAQACFNLNSLSQHDEIQPSVKALYRAQVFEQLLVSLKVEPSQAAQVTAAIEDWLDSNSVPQSDGAEDNEYLAMTPPYLPANRLMKDVSELRSVKGITARIYRQLQPYVCVIPETTLQVNVNTLKPSQARLLSALFLNTLDVTQARQILEDRPNEGWDSIDEFLGADALAGTAEAGDSVNAALCIKSTYFDARLQIQTEQFKTVMHSLFMRKSNNKVMVIRRRFGETQ